MLSKIIILIEKKTINKPTINNSTLRLLIELRNNIKRIVKYYEVVLIVLA